MAISFHYHPISGTDPAEEGCLAQGHTTFQGDPQVQHLCAQIQRPLTLHRAPLRVIPSSESSRGLMIKAFTETKSQLNFTV